MNFYRVKTKTIAARVMAELGIEIIATGAYSYKVSKIKGDRIYEYDLWHGGMNERNFLIHLLEAKNN